MSVRTLRIYTIPQEDQQPTPAERADTVRDLQGVMLDEKLNFREHIHCKINTAYRMVGLIKRNFKYLSISSFVLVYKNLVRSQFRTIVIVCGHRTASLIYRSVGESTQEGN